MSDNAKINAAFGDFKPGIPKREYIAKNLASAFSGYGLQYQPFEILRALKFVNQKRQINAKGKAFLAEHLLGNKSKSLSKTVNSIALNSACSPKDAAFYLSFSKNYQRDSLIIAELSNCGIHKEVIELVIKTVNGYA